MLPSSPVLHLFSICIDSAWILKRVIVRLVHELLIYVANETRTLLFQQALFSNPLRKVDLYLNSYGPWYSSHNHCPSHFMDAPAPYICPPLSWSGFLDPSNGPLQPTVYIKGLYPIMGVGPGLNIQLISTFLTSQPLWKGNNLEREGGRR